jgi:hypothetical protein
MGGQSGGQFGHTANPLDKNNDGRVDARDALSGGQGQGQYRQGDSGDLPRALTEDVSKAQPHSATQTDHHSTGTGSTTGKPSMMDKLNPNVDSNHDGKAGFMK